MSRFVNLPRRVLCPVGHGIPYPRIRPATADVPVETVVGTCPECGTFWVGLGSPAPIACGRPEGREEAFDALGGFVETLNEIVREMRGSA